MALNVSIFATFAIESKAIFIIIFVKGYGGLVILSKSVSTLAY